MGDSDVMANPGPNNSTYIGTPTSETTRIGIAAALPALFGVVLFILLILSIVMPRANRQLSEDECQNQRKARFLDLDKFASPQSYSTWLKRQRKQKSECHIFDESVCVICLEVIEGKSLVRALKCHHVFHKECLDGWFGRLHDYCPLCHRLIISREGGPADENEAERGSINEETALMPQIPEQTHEIIEDAALLRP